jgi:micrococcal nuclease
MKKLFNAVPLLIGITAIAYSCNKSPSKTTSASAFVSTPTNAELWQVKRGSVHDGDTLKVTKGQQEKKIRFACIDAPETKQKDGILSRDYLRSLLNSANNQVYVEAVDEDRYGRTVAQLWIDRGKGKELVQLLEVNAGMVWGYERYKDNCSQWNAIEKGMKEAQAKKLGIWRGNPQPPWEWRKAHK